MSTTTRNQHQAADREALCDTAPDAAKRLLSDVQSQDTTASASIRWGHAAVIAGSPEYGTNSDEIDIADTLASVLHYAHDRGFDTDSLIGQAKGYLEANLEAAAIEDAT